MARNRKRNRDRARETKMAARPPMNKEQMPMGAMMGGSAPMPMTEPLRGEMAEGETPMPMQGGMGTGAMPQGGVEEEGGEPESNVTPEEQALYHKFMENYYTIMYAGGKGEGGKDQPALAEEVRQHFKDIPEPVDALANAAFTVVNQLSDSANAAGKPIPGDVLMHAGTEVVADLAELAEAGGHHEYSQEEIDGAFYKAVDMYREINQNALNMDEIGQDYKTLTEADQAGRLGEVLPGAEKAAEKLPNPEAEGEAMMPQGAQPQGGLPQRGMA